MTTRFPRLLDIFGEVPEQATEAAMQRLVDSRIPEHFDLDFKESLYDDPEKHGASASEKRFDLPTDIAAMANSGGGIIVLGIEAPKPAGVATRTKPVALSDATELRMRQRVASHVFPSISDWTIQRIPLRTNQDQGFYLLLVPSSSMAPHAVARDSGLTYFIRDQSRNRPLPESEVAHRYRNRFEQAHARASRLERVISESRSSCQPTTKPWLEFALTPIRRGELPINETTRLRLRDRLRTATSHLDALGEGSQTAIIEFRHRRIQAKLPARYLLELHSDGSVYWARAQDATPHTFETEKRTLIWESSLALAIGQAIFEFPKFIQNTGRLSGDALLRVSILRGQTADLALRPNDLWMGPTPPSLSGDVSIDRVVNLDSLCSQSSDRASLLREVLTELGQAFGREGTNLIDESGELHWPSSQDQLEAGRMLGIRPQ